jgi:hypothetical protein
VARAALRILSGVSIWFVGDTFEDRRARVRTRRESETAARAAEAERVRQLAGAASERAAKLLAEVRQAVALLRELDAPSDKGWVYRGTGLDRLYEKRWPNRQVFTGWWVHVRGVSIRIGATDGLTITANKPLALEDAIAEGTLHWTRGGGGISDRGREDHYQVDVDELLSELLDVLAEYLAEF